MKRFNAVAAAMLLAMLALATHAAAVSSQDLYNQGNAHARAQEWGLAALDYQRARLLAPEDGDVEANLQFVLAAAKVPVGAPGFTQRLTQLTSPNMAAALGLVGLLLLGGALLLRRLPARLGALLVGVPLVAFAVGHALGLRPLLHTAVVVGGPAAVQASPVPMADTLFSLPEASSVAIVATRPDYLLISAPTGASGWIPRAHLVPVLPPEP